MPYHFPVWLWLNPRYDAIVWTECVVSSVLCSKRCFFAYTVFTCLQKLKPYSHQSLNNVSKVFSWTWYIIICFLYKSYLLYFFSLANSVQLPNLLKFIWIQCKSLCCSFLLLFCYFLKPSLINKSCFVGVNGVYHLKFHFGDKCMLYNVKWILRSSYVFHGESKFINFILLFLYYYFDQESLTTDHFKYLDSLVYVTRFY